MTPVSSLGRTSLDAVSGAMQVKALRVLSSGLNQATAEIMALRATRLRRSSGLLLTGSFYRGAPPRRCERRSDRAGLGIPKRPVR